jgi:hypothetical protein
MVDPVAGSHLPASPVAGKALPVPPHEVSNAELNANL